MLYRAARGLRFLHRRCRKSFGRVCAHQLPDRDFVPGGDVRNGGVFAKLFLELPYGVVRGLPAGTDDHAALERQRRLALYKAIRDCCGCRSGAVHDFAVDGDGPVLLCHRRSRAALLHMEKKESVQDFDGDAHGSGGVLGNRHCPPDGHVFVPSGEHSAQGRDADVQNAHLG